MINASIYGKFISILNFEKSQLKLKKKFKGNTVKKINTLYCNTKNHLTYTVL